MPHLAVEIRRFLRPDAHRFAGFELDTNAPAQHQRELLPGVADKIVELAAFTGNDAGIGGCHAPFGEVAGDRVVVIGAGRVARRRRQRIDHHRHRHWRRDRAAGAQ
ncbi:hypothetical protein D3C75_1206600 [compost metagenome]